jgi:hypothetical protein
MAQDTFSRDIVYGGSFSADGTRITFGSNAGEPEFRCGMMVQNLSYQYAQNISRLYEVGCPDVYLVAGRTQGQVGVSRILGPRRLAAGFYRKFGNACDTINNNILFSANVGCSDRDRTAQDRVLLKHCVLTQISATIGAQDMLINEQLGMMFLIMLLNSEERNI